MRTYPFVNPKLAITLGDAAGIGPEVAVKALQALSKRRKAEIIVLGKASLFNSLAKLPNGEKITNELRGAVAERIRDEATKGVGRDINGKPYVSTDALNKIITNLDKSGKLEYIFGKKGAEHYRTLNEVTKDIQTTPVGAVNTSGTSASLLAALGEMGVNQMTAGIPIPVATIGKHLYGKHQTKKKLTKINEFVNYGKEK